MITNPGFQYENGLIKSAERLYISH